MTTAIQQREYAANNKLKGLCAQCPNKLAQPDCCVSIAIVAEPRMVGFVRTQRRR